MTIYREGDVDQDHDGRGGVERQPEASVSAYPPRMMFTVNQPTVLIQFASAKGTFPTRPITALEIIIWGYPKVGPIDAINPRSKPPTTFPITMASAMLEKGSPKNRDPRAKSAIVRFAPNQSVKALKGRPCLSSSPTCSMPSFSKRPSPHCQEGSGRERRQRGRPFPTVRTYVRISY